jgi:hypothetical protein
MTQAATGAHRVGRGRIVLLVALCMPLAGVASLAFTSPAFGTATHYVVGFNATTSAAVSNAAHIGITTDMLYGGPPSLRSKLGRALTQAHMSVIDGRVSTELYFWECHRTHTVAPPPAGQRNDYCSRDSEPGDTTPVLLAAVDNILRSDGANPLTTGLWVLDDWPSWDGGSARTVLQQIHEEINNLTPGFPAICGFGATITTPDTTGWDPSTAQNYSNEGCEIVGFYNYADTQRVPSNGANLDWSMRSLLPAMESSLAGLGWNIVSTPLLGIGQAWSGRFARAYEPGLSSAQVLSEASAFCNAGATSVGWYGWSDRGFRRATLTPAKSPDIATGIQDGIAACRGAWSG